MANLAEAGHSEGALRWRERALELTPNSLDDRLALAQTAIFSHAYDEASNTLAGVDATGRKTAPYFNVAGELALAVNRPDEAQSDFAEAARLDPSNPAPQLSLAVVELHRTNELDRSEARIALKRISLNSTNLLLRAQAKRELIMDALRFKDYNTAVPLSAELAQATNAPFSDRLLWLESLKLSKNASYSSALAGCESEAASTPGKLGQLTQWLMEQNLHDQALAWLRSLPLQMQTNQPAAFLIAQCQMRSGDWSSLQKTASKQAWGNMEFTRHAYVARALREQGLDGASKAEWDVAMKAANGQLQPLKALFEMTSAWKWPNEGQQVLWAVVNSYPKEQWAGNELAGQLYASGATRPLMQLFTIQYNRNQANLSVGNNLAVTALLLRANEAHPYDLARQVYQKVPTNGNYACTYAFALYLQGKKDEALKIMQGIDAKSLENNSTAGYYGLILNSVGERSKAGPYLRRSTTGPLLPEERTLFQQALLGL
jgi:thioredoxin-like negative regulator of GroEL